MSAPWLAAADLESEGPSEYKLLSVGAGSLPPEIKLAATVRGATASCLPWSAGLPFSTPAAAASFGTVSTRDGDGTGTVRSATASKTVPRVVAPTLDCGDFLALVSGTFGRALLPTPALSWVLDTSAALHPRPAATPAGARDGAPAGAWARIGWSTMVPRLVG
eukprot:scaffold9266_cov110-Isochrysis_galbana.AAC.4